MASQSINNCVITHLLTGLPAARSLARIPSEEAIIPVSLLLIEGRHIHHHRDSDLLSMSLHYS